MLEGVRIVDFPLVLMNRLDKTGFAVFLYCKFSVFLKDPFFQIILIYTAFSSGGGSGESAHMHRLARAFTASIYKVLDKVEDHGQTFDLCPCRIRRLGCLNEALRICDKYQNPMCRRK